MFVNGLLSAAREKLVTIGDRAPLIEAANLLAAGTELVMVCDPAGTLVGVITKTDVVAQISSCHGASCQAAAALVMTTDIMLCQPKDPLHEVWASMKAGGLKNMPVVDESSHPLGLLHARDLLQQLLGESENEEAMLRDYVMGVGYR